MAQYQDYESEVEETFSKLQIKGFYPKHLNNGLSFIHACTMFMYVYEKRVVYYSSVNGKIHKYRKLLNSSLPFFHTRTSYINEVHARKKDGLLFKL